MTIFSVAEKLDVPVKTYRQMEAGTRSMSLDQFFHLAHILQVHVNRLTPLKSVTENK